MSHYLCPVHHVYHCARTKALKLQIKTKAATDEQLNELMDEQGRLEDVIDELQDELRKANVEPEDDGQVLIYI